MILPDGRALAWREFGAPDGLPLLALHGTPGSRLKFSVADPIARDLGIRMLAPDRWGYGETVAHPAPTLQAYATDIRDWANVLGLERFAVMGVSGGGPFATAVAAGLPDRVTALALAAPVGPIAGESPDGMTRFHRLCFGPLARNPAAVARVFSAFRAALAVSPGLGMRLAMVRVAPADRRVLRQADVASRLGDTFVEGLRLGVQGPVIDMTVFGQIWDVDFDAIAAPSRIWLGTADRNVPQVAARRLADRLVNSKLEVLPGEGHLWIANNYSEVLRWIAGNEKGARR
jgi:pimeloyl-ACP methyl ester carboxylesterase